MISHNTIDQVKQLAITDVIGRFIEVKKDLACCPFHEENTPSFRINAKRNRFKCFGCGESGDGIAFVQKHLNLRFSEAIEKIASNHNIAIEIDDSLSPEQRAAVKDKRDLAHKVLAIAHTFYQNCLSKNEAAKEYLYSRQMDDDIIELEELGYCPDDYQSLTSRLTPDLLPIAHEIGLLGQAEKTKHYFDLYRNRIMFPIFDHIGQIIGFGGRILGDAKPKYINPCESFIYSKSNHWYGLDKARKAMHKENNVYIVEGYTDVVAMRREGFENTIACSGTAITEPMIKSLKNYTNTISFMLDGDAAGQKKIREYIHLAIKCGLTAQVCELKDGEDPDSLAKRLLN